jgi:carbamoyl-phosphate synthase large subunit
MKPPLRVMIAGIAGASLGTELLKCLQLADRYVAFGCDISPLAYGHYCGGFAKTFVIDRHNYIDSVLEACRKAEVKFVIPGGEQPLQLLMAAQERLASEGIVVVGNNAAVVRDHSDKEKSFEILRRLGFRVPQTVGVTRSEDLAELAMPCVIKPATGSGGSSFVYLAATREEAWLLSRHLMTNGHRPLAQEYIGLEEGEYSFGLVSLPSADVTFTATLKRTFDSKLSVHSRSPVGLLSSPWGQGLIEEFGPLRAQVEQMAAALGSTGPLSIQGRVRDGVLLPFEINPRFSGTDHLRAMAGFNRLDIFLQYLAYGTVEPPKPLRPGHYLLSLSEVYVGQSDLKT